MIACLLVLSLFCDFNMKWYLPQGVSGFGNTRVLVMDTDRDSHPELIFTTYSAWPAYVFIYELHLPNSWEIDSIPHPSAHLLWDGGDFDRDGLYDLVLQFHFEVPYADGIMIYESPDSLSYPTQEVWRDTVGQGGVAPISVYDVDQDMLPEIISNHGNGQPHWIWVYESMGNNQYDTVCTFSPVTGGYPQSCVSTHAFGDFDDDGAVEYAMADLDGGVYGVDYWVFEALANNTYVQIYQGYVPGGNVKDCITIPDADGDGKLEFMVKGFSPLTGRIEASIIEAVGDNMYEAIKSFDLAGGSVYYFRGLSDAGDVDGDSIPEILIEGCQTVYIVKAAGNDSFYVWETLPGHVDGSCVRVFDLDGNGLSEVIISGNNETRIYEYEVGVAENAPSEIQVMGLSVSPNPFREQTTIRYLIKDSEYSVQNPTLRIYDTSGRLVKSSTLVSSSENQEPSITWRGDDDTGRKLPGGVYFLTLTVGDYSTTAKLLLIR